MSFKKVIDSFVILAESAEMVISRCPWTAERTIEDFAVALESEMEEVLVAVRDQDQDNLKEELGDLLWDTVICVLLAEKNGLFEASEVLDQVVQKMRRRKPFIFNGTSVTVAEAELIWAEAKREEKESQSK